jgi:protoheme IX farnesyltransferase
MPETAAHNLLIAETDESPVALKRFALLKAYYHLTKPGITRMVVLTTTAGYFLGIPSTTGHFSELSHFIQFFLTVTGTAFICAGSCAFNNFIERNSDKLMKRTSGRALSSGDVSPAAGFVYATILSVTGAVLLGFVNLPTFALALATLVSYVAIYTPMKRKSEASLLIGAIPGALPPLGGWVAATGEIALPGLLLFAILFFWQLPHFLSLSWIYRTDYARGGFKMLAVRDTSGKKVAIQALVYAIILMPVAAGMYFTGIVGPLFGIGSLALGIAFVLVSRNFLKATTLKSARNVLMTSYAYLTGVVLLMFIDKI